MPSTQFGHTLTGAHLPFNFQLISAAWTASDIARLIAEYEAALPAAAWPNWVLGNHDNARVASRLGSAQARVAAMLLLTLRGTPTIYYGDEIGMANVPIAPEIVQDPYEPGNRALASAAIPSERRCCGTTRPVPASPTVRHGSRSGRRIKATMLP